MEIFKVGLNMLSFNERLNLFVKIYNIPLEENWSEYLEKTYKNYFEYMNSLGIAAREKNDEYYKLSQIKVNKNLIEYVKELERYYNLKSIKNKSVIDVGCGWGFLSFWLLLSGADKVYAVGFDYQIDFINKLKKTINKNKILLNIDDLITIAKPLDKGIKTIAELDQETADYILYNEVFEHIPDDIFDDALIASYNTLKKGGRLLSVTHNTDNPFVFSQIKSYWSKLEKDYLISIRKKLIIENIPDVNEKDLEYLTISTRGYMKEGFNTVIEQYKNYKILPVNDKLMPAIDLDYDYICENYISPPQVLSKMKRAGFKAYCYPALQRGRRFIPFRPFVKVLRKIFMSLNNFSKAVIFVGIKPSNKNKEKMHDLQNSF